MVAFMAAFVLMLAGYGDLVLESRQRAEMWQIEVDCLELSATPPKVAYQDNAAPFYYRICREQGEPDREQEDKEVQWLCAKSEDISANAEVRCFLQKHSKVLALLHEAATRSGCNFRDYAQERIWEGQVLRPDFFGYVRLLALDMHQKSVDGNTVEAIRDLCALFTVAKHAATCCLEGWDFVQYLPKTRGVALVALQNYLATHRISLDEIARIPVEDAPYYHHILQRILRGAEQICIEESMNLNRSGDISWRMFSLPWRYPSLMMASDRLIGGRRIAQEIYYNSQRPYWEAKQHWGEYERAFGSPLKPYCALTSSLQRISTEAAIADTEMRLARLGIAAYAYRAKNERFPENLDDLVPEFIPYVPEDPFDGKPVRLKNTEHGMVLYSVGPEVVKEENTLCEEEKNTYNLAFELIAPP